MGIITSLGIIIFSMLIMALLQLVPGIFSLLEFYSFGKYHRKKASDQCLFFILGVETAVIVTFLFIYFIISFLPAPASIYCCRTFAWISAGIVFALCIIAFTLYYKKGDFSELFISRRLAKAYDKKAQIVKSRSDAFTLGMTSIIPELLFTLPLFILSAVSITKITNSSFLSAVLIVLFAIMTILPLLITHLLPRRYTLADIMRFRSNNKPFFRFAISLLYLLIAITIILGVSL